MQNAEADRPWLATAVSCEKVLEEKDSAFTIVRVINRIGVTVHTVQPNAPTPTAADTRAIAATLPFPLTGFLSFRAPGKPSGPHSLRVLVHGPSGAITELASFPNAIKFAEGDQMFNVVLQFGLGFSAEGLYWFDVLLDESLVTRMPLQVVFGPPQSPTSNTPTEQTRTPANEPSA